MLQKQFKSFKISHLHPRQGGYFYYMVLAGIGCYKLAIRCALVGWLVTPPTSLEPGEHVHDWPGTGYSGLGGAAAPPDTPFKSACRPPGLTGWFTGLLVGWLAFGAPACLLDDWLGVRL